MSGPISTTDPERSFTVAVIGASGFTGAELLRLCAQHPNLEVVVATGDSQAGTAVGALYPSLRASYPELSFEPYSAERVSGCDVVFLGLPHGASQAIVPELAEAGVTAIDLSADFRLTDAQAYPRWYGEPHGAPQYLERARYGLPELFREGLADASLIAVPGCYPTAAALAMAPLLADGVAATSGIVVDAASGVSGAGRAAKEATTFCAVDETFTAYGLLDHRHTPEIEQSVQRLAGAAGAAVDVLFTPHLAPMNRGILATCYLRPTGHEGVGTTEVLLERYAQFYANEPFVVVTEASPSTKSVAGSNVAHITVRHDERTGWLVALCAIDNLVKGASGQAVQCANIRLGLPETTGLSLSGLYP